MRRRGRAQSPRRHPNLDSGTLSASSSEAPAGGDATPPVRATGATTASSAADVKAAESKLKKIATRLVVGIPMICGFFFLVWLGHPYMVLLVCFLQVCLFRELVNVRYKPAKEKHVPAFRTVQWAMFTVSMCHVYGRIFVKLGREHSFTDRLPEFLAMAIRLLIKHYRFVTFSGYVVTFVGFVLSLRPGLYRYQISNTVWTIGGLAMVVWQVKGAAELIFDGLVWFMLPCGLVVANDCWAYFSGLAFGKRIIKAKFLALSPNKTWEGFIGGFILTVIWGWWFALLISESNWLICPQRNVDPFAHLKCEPADVFRRQSIALPTNDFNLFTIEAKPFQVHAVVLSAFASIVAPFGGFLASAIKRAYKIKDFDSVLPGHGGLMDRMDCQFLMLLCTSVHHRTFVQTSSGFSDDAVLGMVKAMAPGMRESFLAKLFAELNRTDSCVPL